MYKEDANIAPNILWNVLYIVSSYHFNDAGRSRYLNDWSISTGPTSSGLYVTMFLHHADTVSWTSTVLLHRKQAWMHVSCLRVNQSVAEGPQGWLAGVLQYCFKLVLSLVSVVTSRQSKCQKPFFPLPNRQNSLSHSHSCGMNFIYDASYELGIVWSIQYSIKHILI